MFTNATGVVSSSTRMFFPFWRAIGSHIGNGSPNDETSKSLVFVGDDEGIIDLKKKKKLEVMWGVSRVPSWWEGFINARNSMQVS